MAAKTHDWSAARSPLPADHPGFLGRHERTDHARFDEVGLVANLLGARPAGSIMVDVGAHRGASLAPFLKQGWRVIAFEPDRENRSCLQARFPGAENLVIDARAVSDCVGESQFFTSPESTGIASLVPFHPSHQSADSVQLTTLANVVEEYDLAAIDFLKIDAESMDLMVLKGLAWDRLLPEVILCEFEDRKTASLGYTVHDMARYLQDKGYTVFVSEWHPIIRYGISHDWRRLVAYPVQLGSQSAWGNLLAFRSPPAPEQLEPAARQCLRVNPEPKPEAPPSSGPLTLLKARLSRHAGLYLCTRFLYWSARILWKHKSSVVCLAVALLLATLFLIQAAPQSSWLLGLVGGALLSGAVCCFLLVFTQRERAALSGAFRSESEALRGEFARRLEENAKVSNDLQKRLSEITRNISELRKKVG